MVFVMIFVMMAVVMTMTGQAVFGCLLAHSHAKISSFANPVQTGSERLRIKEGIFQCVA